MTSLSFSRSRKSQSRPGPGSPPRAAHAPAGVGIAPATPSVSRQPILTRAETAPCTCPEHCERDHDDG